jgi:TolB-like protein
MTRSIARLALHAALLTALLAGAGSAAAADAPAAPSAPATAEPPTVAVAYFDDHTGDPAFAPLRKGLADMLITDLSAIGSIRIVERERLNAVLSELELAQGQFIDPATAQKLGRGLSARYILTGAYTVAGEEMRLDARVIEVETAKVAAAEKVEGPKAAFFALEKELVEVLVATLDLKLPFAEKAKLRSVPTESFEAWLAYSAGLDAVDRGDTTAAQQQFRAALAADPGYASAKTALGRLEAIFARSDRERAERIHSLTDELDPQAPDFGTKVDALLRTFDDSVEGQLRQKIELLTWLVAGDLTPSHLGFPRVPLDILGLLSRFLNDPDTWPRLPGVCEYVITRYPTYPGSTEQCKVYVGVMKKMQEFDAEQLRRSFREDQEGATHAWHVAIVRNTPAIYALFDACAKKVEAGR